MVLQPEKQRNLSKMAADPNHLTNIYDTSPLINNYCTTFTDDHNQSYKKIADDVENTQKEGHMKPMSDEAMSVFSSTDDSAAAAAVFRHLDNFVRERINGELEKLKHNVHKILSDQQQDFARAFGLHGELFSSEALASHVVPKNNHSDETSSDGCQFLAEGDSDCDAAVVTQYDYNEQICPNCNSCLESAASENPSKDKEEEKIAMNYLLRLMIASSKLGSALKRIEYRM